MRAVNRKRSATLSLRLNERDRHLLDIMQRVQRRTITTIIESAVLAAATAEELDVVNATWAETPEERLRLLIDRAPGLCSIDERESIAGD